jgi:hypothetical protein
MFAGTGRFALAVTIAALAAVPATAATKVSGFFRLGDTRIEVGHGCGYRVESDEPGVHRTLLFLSTVPLDCAAAESALDPESALDDQVREKEAGSIRIVVGPEGSEQGMYAFSSKPFDSFNTSGSGTWATTVNTPERSEGSWRTSEPEEFFDKTFEYDLAWGLDLLSGPVRGEALPADGGDPGKALVAYVKAVAGDDRNGVKAVLTSTQRQEVFANEGTEWFADQWTSWRQWELAEVEVQGGRLDGDRATLRVRGKQGDGEKVRGLVRMVREDGAWKLDAKKVSIYFE